MSLKIVFEYANNNFITNFKHMYDLLLRCTMIIGYVYARKRTYKNNFLSYTYKIIKIQLQWEYIL